MNLIVVLPERTRTYMPGSEESQASIRLLPSGQVNWLTKVSVNLVIIVFS